VKNNAEKEGEPIPVKFIPRKPHPNGLLEYILASYITHPCRSNSILPIILDIVPHVKMCDYSPTEAAIILKNRYFFY